MDQDERISLQYVSFEVDASSTARMWAVYNAIGGPLGAGSDHARQSHYFRFLVDHLVNTLNHQIAQNRIAPQTANRLTVFAAPEFYFTDRLRGGSVQSDLGQPFSQEVVAEGLDYMHDQLGAIAGNVLVVGGSIWSWEPYIETRDEYTEMAGGDAPNVAIHNITPTFYRGDRVHTWHKQNLSQLDGLGDPARNWGPATHWDQTIQDEGWNEDDIQVGDAQPEFTIQVDGIDVNVGIEVCLDHLAGVRHLRNHNDGHVDVHMLVCAAMPPDGESVACRVGGVFLRCEGGANYGNERSNAGTLTDVDVITDAVPDEAASQTYEAVAARPAHVDERVRIYNPINIDGPS